MAHTCTKRAHAVVSLCWLFCCSRHGREEEEEEGGRWGALEEERKEVEGGVGFLVGWLVGVRVRGDRQSGGGKWRRGEIVGGRRGDKRGA